MSNRELAINIINQIPEYKLSYVIDMLKGLKGLLNDDIEEVEPDEWDLAMIAEAERENDEAAISFEEMLAKDGVTYADIQL